ILVALFIASQLVGLFIANHYLKQELPYGITPPDFKEETSFLPLFFIILATTFIVIILIRFRLGFLWKLWFFFAVLFALSVSFSAIMSETPALIIALVLALVKIFKPNVFVHNFSEVFIYGGLAAIFSPVLSLFSISILLVIISVYDAIAVWKTKHMISLAKFQAESKLFAGLLVPYGKKTAILGGGDIGFPLLFNAVLLKNFGLLSLIGVLFSAAALFILLCMSKKNRFYPAMPFISAGCFLALLVIKLLSY
ncbi:MAG: presenilin family intramembrane aspartyl protease, partial [Nanoarchaeota archaeon]